MKTNVSVLALLSAVTMVAGCVYVERPYHPRPYYEPAPVVVAPAPVYGAPVYVDEGAVYQGVVVAPVETQDYVWVNGGWYYWHPGGNVWVHAHRSEGWHPPREAHVYQSWSEHPMYHAHPGPVVVERHGPVVAEPAPVVVHPRPVVVAAAPVFVEEGVKIGGVVVASPGAVDYVSINGGWYYWHPGVHQWVHAHHPDNWAPPRGVHVYHSWDEHPMYKKH